MFTYQKINWEIKKEITKFYPPTYHHTRCISCYKLRKGKNGTGLTLPHHWSKDQCERCHYLGKTISARTKV